MVMKVLRHINPEDSLLRKQHRLQRRVYHNKVYIRMPSVIYIIVIVVGSNIILYIAQKVHARSNNYS